MTGGNEVVTSEVRRSGYCRFRPEALKRTSRKGSPSRRNIMSPALLCKGFANGNPGPRPVSEPPMPTLPVRTGCPSAVTGPLDLSTERAAHDSASRSTMSLATGLPLQLVC